MKALYPLAIDSPLPAVTGPDGKIAIPAKPWNQVIVRSPEEHRQKFPEHYEEFQKKARREAATPRTLEQAVLAERNRAASIASNWPKGGVIAKAIAEAIRAGSPSEPEESDSAPIVGDVVQPEQHSNLPVSIAADAPDAPQLPVMIQAEAPPLR